MFNAVWDLAFLFALRQQQRAISRAMLFANDERVRIEAAKYTALREVATEPLLS